MVTGNRQKIQMILLAALFGVLNLGLSACGTTISPQPTATPPDVGAIQTAAVDSFVASLTALVPRDTGTLIPTATLTPTETPLPPTFTPTLGPTEISFQVLNSEEAKQLLPTFIAFYVIAPESEEDCKYYLRPVLAYPYQARTGDVVADVKTALDLLFNFQYSYPGGFPNPLLPAKLEVRQVVRSGNSMDVFLTGNPAKTDNFCTNRQMRDQVTATINKIANEFEIYDVVIWLDQMLYDDIMIADQ